MQEMQSNMNTKEWLFSYKCARTTIIYYIGQATTHHVCQSWKQAGNVVN